MPVKSQFDRKVSDHPCKEERQERDQVRKEIRKRKLAGTMGRHRLTGKCLFTPKGW